MKINVLAILFILPFIIMKSQNASNYARLVVDKLGSDELAGRGYTHDGLKKAEQEIVNQFEKIGLQKFGNSYLQAVSYPINIIESASLNINGKQMEFGRDFVLSGFSKSDKAKLQADYFDISVIDSAFIYEDYEDLYNEVDRLEGKAIVFDTISFPPNYISDGKSANDMYREIKYSYDDQLFENNNKVLIEIVPDKLTMGLSNVQKNTHHIYLKASSAPENIESVSYSISSRFEPNFQTNNIIGYIPGRNPNKKILITAHYDHLGQVDDAIFKGANDNASGIALVLSLAKYFSINPPEYTMVFVAFTGEEAGLMGSKYFVDHPPFPLNQIALVSNFDIVGTGDEGVKVVNSAKYPKIFDALNFINNKHSLLAKVSKRGEACNSDHCPFDLKGIPAIFTYTLGGKPYYHDIDDTPENLTLAEFDDVFFLYSTFLSEYRD